MNSSMDSAHIPWPQALTIPIATKAIGDDMLATGYWVLVRDTYGGQTRLSKVRKKMGNEPKAVFLILLLYGFVLGTLL